MNWLFNIHNMFGLPEASDREHVGVEELGAFVGMITFGVYGHVNIFAVDGIFRHLMQRPDMLRRRLVILRRAISYEGNLSHFLSDPEDLTDCQLRELFRAVESRVAHHFGEKPIPTTGVPFSTAGKRSEG